MYDPHLVLVFRAMGLLEGSTWEDIISINGDPCIPNFTVYYRPGIEGFIIDESHNFIDLWIPVPLTWYSVISAIEKVLGCHVGITTF